MHKNRLTEGNVAFHHALLKFSLSLQPSAFSLQPYIKEAKQLKRN